MGLDINTVLLAITAIGVAIASPFLTIIVRNSYLSPKLDFEFNFGPGSRDSHQTKMRHRMTGEEHPVYYFLFEVANTGKSAAIDCEVILEKIWQADDVGNQQEWKNFLPVNLRWSEGGCTNGCSKMILSKGRRLCNMGLIKPYRHQIEDSIYRNISPQQKETNKFFFDQYGSKFFYQWDCLLPGKYEIQVSVYSRNAPKATRKFSIDWSGDWYNEEKEMFSKGIKMSML